MCLADFHADKSVDALYVQVEIDFKSECLAGDTVESLGSRIVEETNGAGIIRYSPTGLSPSLHAACYSVPENGYTVCA